jgi:hypothetical protein
MTMPVTDSFISLLAMMNNQAPLPWILVFLFHQAKCRNTLSAHHNILFKNFKIMVYFALKLIFKISLTSLCNQGRLHGASREARQVNKHLAPSYLLRVDINLPTF